jgi:hypothetical protein
MDHHTVARPWVRPGPRTGYAAYLISPSHMACRPRARSTTAQKQLQVQYLLEMGIVAHDMHKLFTQGIVPIALLKCQKLLELV